MNILVNRVEPSDLGTLGTMAIDGKFVGYTLEDAEREVKIAGETCIPKGTYRVLLRNEGGMTKKYASKYGKAHKGMLWLQDVEGFKWVYIHVGNTVSDTDGCILVGKTWHIDGTPFVGRSVDAYTDIYSKIAPAIEDGDDVWLTVT